MSVCIFNISSIFQKLCLITCAYQHNKLKLVCAQLFVHLLSLEMENNSRFYIANFASTSYCRSCLVFYPLIFRIIQHQFQTLLIFYFKTQLPPPSPLTVLFCAPLLLNIFLLVWLDLMYFFSFL